MKTHEHWIRGLNLQVTFYIGENREDNPTLLNVGKPTDYWFHAYDQSSAHVVASVPEGLTKRQLRYIVKTGAWLCKQHTPKLRSCNKVPFVYTLLHYVKPTDIAGTVTLDGFKVIDV